MSFAINLITIKTTVVHIILRKTYKNITVDKSYRSLFIKSLNILVIKNLKQI